MAWFMIIIGSTLTMFGVYRIFGLSKNIYLPDNNNENIKDQKKKKSSSISELEDESRELEKTIKNNNQRLRRLNSDMGTIINELSWKEKSIKRTLETLRVEISSNLDNEHNHIKSVNKTDSFEDILNKNLASEQEEKIPEKYLEIFKLYDLGMTPDEIAEEMDIGVRETKLIFKLYGKGAEDAIR